MTAPSGMTGVSEKLRKRRVRCPAPCLGEKIPLWALSEFKPSADERFVSDGDVAGLAHKINCVAIIVTQHSIPDTQETIISINNPEALIAI